MKDSACTLINAKLHQPFRDYVLSWFTRCTNARNWKEKRKGGGKDSSFLLPLLLPVNFLLFTRAQYTEQRESRSINRQGDSDVCWLHQELIRGQVAEWTTWNGAKFNFSFSKLPTVLPPFFFSSSFFIVVAILTRNVEFRNSFPSILGVATNSQLKIDPPFCFILFRVP